MHEATLVYPDILYISQILQVSVYIVRILKCIHTFGVYYILYSFSCIHTCTFKMRMTLQRVNIKT